MIVCQEKDGVCTQCGFKIEPRMRRTCAKGGAAHPSTAYVKPKEDYLSAQIEMYGLGNLVESALESCGVTKDRWIAFKTKVGLPSTCNCTRKKEYLNQLGREFGEAAHQAVIGLLGIGRQAKQHDDREEK